MHQPMLALMKSSSTPVHFSPLLSITCRQHHRYLVEWDRSSKFTRGIPSNGVRTYIESVGYSEVVTTTSYQITGLEEGETYYIRVTAYGADLTRENATAG